MKWIYYCKDNATLAIWSFTTSHGIKEVAHGPRVRGNIILQREEYFDIDEVGSGMEEHEKYITGTIDRLKRDCGDLTLRY